MRKGFPHRLRFVMRADTQKIEALFHEANSFAILSHVRPDGDAYGTSLALALALQGLGKKVAVYNQDGLLKTYQYLPGAPLIQPTPAAGIAPEVKVLAVDTSTYERLGEGLTKSQRVVDLNLDHHASNTLYGRINHVVGDSPASAQVLYELLEELRWPVTADIASNLYVGLMTDTGSFRYRGTTARTFEMAGKLVAAGADPSALADSCYRTSSLGQFLLMREVLQATCFHAGHRVACYRLTPEMFARTGAVTDEVENYLDMLQTIDTVEVAFMLQEIESGATRVSLRSRARIDVGAIAAAFGGGGHKLAAGIRSMLPAAELENNLLAAIEQALSKI